MIISQMVRSKKHQRKGSWPLITANTKQLPGATIRTVTWQAGATIRKGRDNMKDLSIIEINDAGERRVSGRQLHSLLRVTTPYTIWFARMCDYKFVENTDFWTDYKNVIRADGTRMPQQQVDHQLSIDMAKEICMLQRSEIGQKIRRYFIAAEAAWNSPEAVMARAIQLQQNRQQTLETQMNELTASLEAKTAQITEMEPKVTYYELVLSCLDAIPITVIAKDYGWSAVRMNNWLHQQKILYRMGRTWLLYQDVSEDGYTKSETHSYRDKLGNVHTEIRLKWTQKGRLFIYELMKKAGILPLCEMKKEEGSRV